MADLESQAERELDVLALCSPVCDDVSVEALDEDGVAETTEDSEPDGVADAQPEGVTDITDDAVATDDFVADEVTVDDVDPGRKLEGLGRGDGVAVELSEINGDDERASVVEGVREVPIDALATLENENDAVGDTVDIDD
jgi:hypothetical protein